MELTRALDEIRAIHEHLARTEVYRGYRPFPVAFSGLCALAAAAAQPAVVGRQSPRAYVFFWVAVAAVSLAAVAGEIAWRYFVREDEAARRRTRLVLAQFAPCLIAGACATAGFLAAGPGGVALLPGAWALLFGLGVAASRPYLPRAASAVTLFYLAAGALLLATAAPGTVPSGWGMGLTFGLGQLHAAWVVHRNG
jgi:hypothetical protein